MLATLPRCSTSYFPVTCGHSGDGTEQMCASQGTALSERAERATGTVCVVKSPPYMDLSSQMLSALKKPSGRHPWELLYQASYREAELRSTSKCILFHTKARFTLQTVPPPKLLKDGGLIFAVFTKILNAPPQNNSTCVQGGRVDRYSVNFLS